MISSNSFSFSRKYTTLLLFSLVGTLDFCEGSEVSGYFLTYSSYAKVSLLEATDSLMGSGHSNKLEERELESLF